MLRQTIHRDGIDLLPTFRSSRFNDYVKKDLENINGYDWWSTLHPKKLTKFNLTTFASSTLNNFDSYKSANLCDGKAETAWVEGAKKYNVQVDFLNFGGKIKLWYQQNFSSTKGTEGVAKPDATKNYYDGDRRNQPEWPEI